jgi:hypothetical protein
MLRRTARTALALPALDAAEPAIAEPDAAAAEPEPDGGSAEMFGIETEGLSPEDRDLEIARRVVRFAGDAVQRLSNERTGDPAQAARRAFLAAAQRHAPGLASRLRAGNSTQSTGRWIRRGETIVILGA